MRYMLCMSNDDEGGGIVWGGFVFFFKQKTAYEISACLVGSEMCIRDRYNVTGKDVWYAIKV